MVLIFLEGVDKEGKTFFGQELSRILNIPIFRGKNVPRSKKELFEKSFEVVKNEINMFYELVKQKNISLIVDRFYLSDWVYAKVFGGYVDENFIWTMDDKFSLLGSVIVFFDADDNVLSKRWNGEEIISFQEISSIRKYYNIALDRTFCKVYYFYVVEDTDVNLKRIKMLAEIIRDRVHAYASSYGAEVPVYRVYKI